MSKSFKNHIFDFKQNITSKKLWSIEYFDITFEFISKMIWNGVKVFFKKKKKRERKKEKKRGRYKKVSIRCKLMHDE